MYGAPVEDPTYTKKLTLEPFFTLLMWLNKGIIKFWNEVDTDVVVLMLSYRIILKSELHLLLAKYSDLYRIAPGHETRLVCSFTMPTLTVTEYQHFM